MNRPDLTFGWTCRNCDKRENSTANTAYAAKFNSQAQAHRHARGLSHDVDLFQNVNLSNGTGEYYASYLFSGTERQIGLPGIK